MRCTVSRFRGLILRVTGILPISVLFASLVVGGGGERDAEATVPGFNGKIAFERYTETSQSTDIFVVNPDGSDVVNLTNSTEWELGPVWSPDGQRIAFYRSSGLWVMDPDGSNQAQFTDSGNDPSWHPDGTKIAFLDIREQGDATYVLDLMTNEISFLVPGGGAGVGFQSSWSPDGTKIAYSDGAELAVANSDGSDPLQLTFNGSATDLAPSWSPDSSKIAYRSYRTSNGEIFLIEPDGSDDTNLTNSANHEEAPSWSPDGTRMVYQVTFDVPTPQEIWMMNADGTNQTPFIEGSNPDWQTVAEDPGYAAFPLATPTPVPSVTPTPADGEFPSGFPAGGGDSSDRLADLPFVLAGAGLLVVALGTWYARRR
jgi:Tol biopolymer transport system component